MKYRKNVRLKRFDYSSNGYYLVTICTYSQKPYFKNGVIKDFVAAELAQLNQLPGVTIDYHVIMPTHLHLIVILQGSKFELSEIIRRFKSKTTVLIKKQAEQVQQLQRLWQSNYYEHVIRDERALVKIREYIVNNPPAENIKWGELNSQCSC